MGDVEIGWWCSTGIIACFCDGYEDQGAASVGVLAVGDVNHAGVALHMARMAKRLSRKVTVYASGDEELAKELVVAIEDEDIGWRGRKC